MNELLELLRKPFDVTEVQQRSQGGTTLDYVSIDATINRVLDATDGNYHTHIKKVECYPMEDGKFFAFVHLQVSLPAGDWDGYIHDGVGAMINRDPDMAVKTALAEAFKKAMHYWGVGLELWDADHRDYLATMRAAMAGDVGALKRLVYLRAVEAGADDVSTGEGIASHFGVTVDDLADADKLRELAFAA